MRKGRLTTIPYSAVLKVLLLVVFGIALGGAPAAGDVPEGGSSTATSPPPIRLSDDGADFVFQNSTRRFIPWGFNYDHDRDGRLIEDYWVDEWPTVVEDFGEMKALGANVVRVHLQTAKFVVGPRKINDAAFARLRRLARLAEETGLYLNITGLGCYHKQDVPAWYDALDEARRWEVQALFWSAVAKTCAESRAVFCYDLMNEPILPGKKKETEWLAGDFNGKHFVQRISLDLGGRTRQEVAKAWVEAMVAAIRRHDKDHLITVGVIPWAYTFPGAKPLFYSTEVGERLDFVSVHFYPERGRIDEALAALAVYDVGKPLVIEEIFPLKCGIDEFDVFIQRSRDVADGWIGFYWGKTRAEYLEEGPDIRGAMMVRWLEYFKSRPVEADRIDEENTRK